MVHPYSSMGKFHHHHKTSFNDLHDTYDSYDTLRMSASWDLRSLKALLNGYAKSQNSQRAAQWLECMEANDIKPSISAHLSPAMSPMYPMTEDESHLPGIFEFKLLTDLTVRSLFWGAWCFVLLMNQATSGRGWLAERQGETPHAWHVQSQSCWVTKVQLRVLSE